MRIFEAVDIPSTVTVIGIGAFRMCTSLQRLSLNVGLEQIGERSFFGCDSLKRVAIPSNVTVIGNGAFQKCTLLESLLLGEGLDRIGV
eukprot:scaffold4814_cov64-Cylindrotheca_fusiformis.AAC.1